MVARQRYAKLNSFIWFFKKHELLIDVEPFDEEGNLKTDTVLKKSNLTPEGQELFDIAVDGWFDYLARSTVTCQSS